MTALFYVAAAVACVATLLAITRTHAVHALLYVIVSFLAVATIFFALGAPFVAALEVIVYAGAIMVLFVFVVMLLDLGPRAAREERRLLTPGAWAGPLLLSAVLAFELVWLLARAPDRAAGQVAIGPTAVAHALFGPYVLGVEIVSVMLLGGLVAAYHLGNRDRQGTEGQGDG